MERYLSRHLTAKRKAQGLPTGEKQTPIQEAPRSLRRSPKGEQKQKAYQEERLARYEQVMALCELGFSQQAIADQVGIGHSTVSRWLAAGTLPETRRGPYASRLDPYLPYLFGRWDSGCHNMVRLHQELVERGFKGSYESVRDHIVRRLPDGKKQGAMSYELAPVPLPSKSATFLFLRRPEELDEKEQETLQELRQLSEEVDLAYDLVQQFARDAADAHGREA